MPRCFQRPLQCDRQSNTRRHCQFAVTASRRETPIVALSRSHSAARGLRTRAGETCEAKQPRQRGMVCAERNRGQREAGIHRTDDGGG
jgi:hypothetical protein